MAKLYGEIAAKALLTLDKSFARANGQPLDASEVYYSLAAAQEYAAGAQAYVGQKIVVIEEGVVTHYSVNDTEGTLKELGSKPVADGTTVSIDENGKITLANIAEKAEGTYNAVLVNGVLTWVKPSETTVEGLSDLINALTGRVDSAEEAISANADAIKAIADDYLKAADKTELVEAIAAEKTRAEEAEQANADAIKAIADDYLKAADKTELSDAIAAEKTRAEGIEAGLQNQINLIMNNPDTKDVIDSIEEFKTYIEEHGTIAEGFRTDINKNVEDIAALDERLTVVENFDHSVYATIEGVNEIEAALEEAIAAEAETARAAEEANANAIADLQAADATLIERIESLEEHDHASYATKVELTEVSTVANNASTAVTNLETRFDEIVAVGGEPNAINTIQVNGVTQAIDNKTVNIVVPTKFSDLTDDSGFNDRINAAQNKADQGVTDAAAAQATANQAQSEVDALELVVGEINTTLAAHTETIGNHSTRITALENADTAHAAEYEALHGIVTGHTELIAKKADATTVEAVSSKASANEAAINAIKETTIPAINEEIAKKADATALNNYYTKSEITAITGDLGEKTVVELIDEAKSEATYDDTEVRQLIADEAARADLAEKANAAAIAENAAAIAKTDALLASVFENDDDTSLNSFKELAVWITEHGTEATKMAEGIQANAEAIAANAEAIAAINDTENGVLAQANAYTDAQIAALPVATAEVLGLVKFDNDTIKMNENNQLYVNKVSTDVLVQGEQILVLNGGSDK